MKLKIEGKKKVIEINGEKFGNGHKGIIAGPCAIESEKQLVETARVLKKNNIKIMRASAYKPRTNPYAFQGMEEEGLEMLARVGKKVGIATETEITDTRQVEKASEMIDVLRVGARNMQNYELLKELSKIENPVILKNGLASTIDEFLMAGEYLARKGKENIIFCWRGIRTFEKEVRYSMDALAPHIIKQKTRFPVIVDPSHAAGKKENVLPLSRAMLAGGADGLIIETHPNPEKALSDNRQQIPLKEFQKFLKKIDLIHK